jgi:hypothetical protein
MRPVSKLLLHHPDCQKAIMRLPVGDRHLWQILHPHPVCKHIIRWALLSQPTPVIKPGYRIRRHSARFCESLVLCRYRVVSDHTGSAPKPVHKAVLIIRSKPNHSKKNICMGDAADPTCASFGSVPHSPAAPRKRKGSGSARAAPGGGSGPIAMASQWPPELAPLREQTSRPGIAPAWDAISSLSGNQLRQSDSPAANSGEGSN